MTVCAIGCGDDKNPISPSSEPAPTVTVVSNPTSNNDVSTIHAPDLVDPVNTVLYAIEGPGGCLEELEYEWVVTVREEGYRLRTASFHENDASCEPTMRKPGGEFEILEIGNPGDTIFRWDAARECGRYQADIAIGDEATETFETIVGVVINTGIDCVDPVVEEVPDEEPPVEEPDEEVEPEDEPEPEIEFPTNFPNGTVKASLTPRHDVILIRMDDDLGQGYLDVIEGRYDAIDSNYERSVILSFSIDPGATELFYMK